MVLATPQRVLGFLYAFFVFIPLLALADGKVFRAHVVAAPVTTPDQRALLYYSNGVERLVIETSFVGEGTNFAWVVPLPSAPTIEAVSEGFFASLNTTYQPKLIHYIDDGILRLLLFGIAVASISIFAYRRGGVFLVAPFTLLVVLLGALLIPNFGRARSKSMAATSAKAVTILDQQHVGVYDTVTLSGTGGRELLDWLNLHRFYTPTNALPVLSRYAAQGWVFVAATVHRDNQSGRSQPHPLAFTFKTEKAVYPLQLTGIENDDCSIELFVFGPSGAAADRFRAEYCGVPFSVPPGDLGSSLGFDRQLFFPPKPGEFRISNAEIERLAMPAAVTTKLVGTLSPGDMRSDAWIRWVGVRKTYPVLYSREGARKYVLNWFVGIMGVCALVIQIASPHVNGRTIFNALFALIVLGALGSLIFFASLKTTEVRTVRGGYHASINHFFYLKMAIEDLASDWNDEAPLEFGKLTNNLVKYRYEAASQNNCFTGGPLRNEASPGNLTLASRINGVQVIWYDINGSPHGMATFPIRR